MTSIQKVWVALIAVAIMAIIGWFTPAGQLVAEKAGAISGVTNFSKLGVTELKVGSGCGDGFTYAGCTGLLINATSGFVLGFLATFDAGVTYSYTNSTSTTATAETATASEIANYTTVIMTPNVGALTITLPASSTLSAFLPAAGDRMEQCWYNATGTAAMNIIFAAGTGIDLEVASSTGLSAQGAVSTNLSIGPGNSGCFKFIRKPATATAFDIVAQFQSFRDGD